MPYPMLFEPLLKEKVWGDRRLESLGKTLPPGIVIGESWEIADLPESIDKGRSTIANGPLVGRTLHEAMVEHRAAILGTANPGPGGGFPLLIKYLDAGQNLSVQAHPDEAYVRGHPQTHLKSEAWVVVDAEPGAVIYKGLRPGVTPDRFAEHIRAGTVIDDLRVEPAVAGACHDLPSGTCHALGAGTLVAEVQTPSDTTFRVFDWGRTGRPLHIDEALECIRFEPYVEPPPGPPPIDAGGCRTEHLLATPYFAIERFTAVRETSIEAIVPAVPVVWMVLAGEGRLTGTTGPAVTLATGTTVLLPAGLEDGRAELAEGTVVLRVVPAGSLDRALA
jgi:mannose-6-phosphate isomerase